MELTRLLSSLPGVMGSRGRLDILISHISADSRQVRPGTLFVAYRGVSTDGHRFIPDALARGAAAVVGEQPIADLPVPYIQVTDGRAALGWLSAAWYGHPSRDMALIGITGTDGKTTTANLLFSILRAAGQRAGLISTVHAVIGDRAYDTGLHTTTPDAPDVQRYLDAMRTAQTEVVVLEATSIGLAQQRLAGCIFDVAAVTNITHEHLDAHGTFEAYREAKASLFRALIAGPTKTFRGRPLLKTAVLNRDDAAFDFLAAIPAERTICYGVGGEPQRVALPANVADGLILAALNVRHGPAGLAFEMAVEPIHRPAEHLHSPRQAVVHLLPTAVELTSPLVGDYNVSNILAAAGAALALEIDLPAIQAGVRHMAGIPGRAERIHRGQAFTAIVDFAHTPNALARILETAHTLVAPGGRVLVVFGCAGLRDREKRRLMGEVAARLADLTVITAEDPRTEDLASIMAETAAALMNAGRVEGHDFVRIADRQRAILHAVRTAQPGDVVLICGKGHEQSMCFGTVEYPWHDQEALAWALDVAAGRTQADPPFRLPTW